MRAALRAAGHREYPYDLKRTAGRLAVPQVSPEVREAAIVRVAQLLERPVDEVRADLDRRAAE
ncbi:hypothetical protein [Plantactinospora sp. KLBMP9567]|uniref:hypothetical protein n=1 Tax=Plantactinospora sp. KLBMP9567 TaxID=3085900 RepID=UPI00298188A5|nr:hypothetical protein [Plantactinospora sp. KLBMP9567]MDW5326163.1 hypothetical protein [Plantactinospora sp. KLBMP9567]